MAKMINITRDNTGKVTFETVSIDNTENVCFANLDPQEAHWPTLTSNQLGAAPSPNSNECVVPPPTSGQTKVVYGCKIDGHGSEMGIINVFPQLSASNTTLAPAKVGVKINEQQVVKGGQPFVKDGKQSYAVNSQRFQVADSSGVLQSGSGIGPGLTLNNTSTTQGMSGITVTGTPTLAGTYTFRLDVSDAMQRNLQQQYTMVVTAS